MSELTRGGVAYNLDVSPYRYNVDYKNSTVTFCFSSSFYQDNFIRKLKTNREKINKSLSNRFGFNFENNVLCDMKLYTSIEKRGFLLYQNGERFECLSTITLDGETMIQPI